MRPELLDIIVCPSCKNDLVCLNPRGDDDEIDTATLRCSVCRSEYPVLKGIPRFVSSENYASSFGMQWNMFRAEQIDSLSGYTFSRDRFWAETGWDPQWMRGKLILDAGCGAGRFLDVVSKADCDIVGVDLSESVDACKQNLGNRRNVHLVQASLYSLPFRTETFDGCYCLGVIQHTPDPQQAIRALPRILKKGGRLAFFIYERKPWTKLYSKYLLRPFTRRMKPKILLRLIKVVMPVMFPITEITFRLPLVGRLFAFAIPVSNYVGAAKGTAAGLSLKERYRWALMDTFDMLAPRYDEPQKETEVFAILRQEGISDLSRTARYGLCFEGKKL